MTDITVHPVDTSTERKIITALIVSTKFCAQIIPILHPEYIEVDYVKIIVRWVSNYYKEYKKAPANHIQDLFEQNKKRLKPAMVEIIESFLIKLSENYLLDNIEIESFNSDYYIDLAYEHFRERSLQLHLSIVNSLLEQGKRKEAGEEVEKFRQLQKDIYPYETLTPEVVERVLLRKEVKPLLTFPGKLGDLIGNIDRGWLVGFLAPTKRGKCLVGSSEILLSNGKIKTIKQMFDKNRQNKYKVVGLNDNFDLIEEKVEQVVCTGEQPVYKIRTRTGRAIKLTKNHPLLTTSGWKELGQLKEKDYIAVPRELIFWGKETLPEYKLRLLGYLISEGGLTKEVSFTNYDYDLLEDFKRCVIAMEDRITEPKNGDGRVLYVRKKIPYSHMLPNHTEKWLTKLGLFGKKSSDKFIPNIIYSLNKKDVALFLRTLFTGDGHVCIGPTGGEVGYGSMSEKLVRQIQHLLLRFGIISTVKSRKTWCGTIGWGVIIRDKDNVIKFINIIGFLFSKGEKARTICNKLLGKKRRRGFMDVFPGEYSKVINSYIKRPKNRAWYRQLPLRWLEKSLYTGGTLNREVVQDIAGIINNKELDKIAYSDVLWDRIESIEFCGKEQTYDLCLRNIHNFVANDFIVHNSWILLETAFQSVISGAKCLFISLEMSADEVWDRFIKRITSCGEREGSVFYPVFDCLRNQDGSCTIKNRINKVKLLKDGMFKPEPGKEPIGYKPCAVCRTDYTGGKNHPYIPETWFEGIKRERLDYAMALKKISGINRMYNMNKIFRVLTFPAHTMNIAKMEVYLKQWEDNDGWIPDVIIIDYADILAPEDNREIGRDRIDNTWQELKRTSSSRRCVLATASQANRASFEKFIVKQIHTSEDIRKIAHGDLWIALNQTPWEKKAGVIRFGVIAHRHKEFLETESVTVLQNLSVGQVLLDSEWGVVESFLEKKKE